jgi:hypothetical protein
MHYAINAQKTLVSPQKAVHKDTKDNREEEKKYVQEFLLRFRNLEMRRRKACSLGVRKKQMTRNDDISQYRKSSQGSNYRNGIVTMKTNVRTFAFIALRFREKCLAEEKQL